MLQFKVKGSSQKLRDERVKTTVSIGPHRDKTDVRWFANKKGADQRLYYSCIGKYRIRTSFE